MDKSLYSGRSFVGKDSIMDDYKKGKIQRPNRKDPEITEDKEFYLSWARYIWALYCKNECSVPYGGYTYGGKSYAEVRQYALGRQDSTIYQNRLDPCERDEATGKNVAHMNINWDIHPILPKFRDVVRGKLLGVDYEPNTQAIDLKSRKSRIDTVNKMKLKVNPNMQSFMQQNGLNYDGVKVPTGIKSADDVDFFEKLGGVRLEREIMLKNAIECTQYESDWKTLKDMLINNAIDYNVVAVKTKHHQNTGKIKVSCVHPEDLVCRGSEYPDHRDIDFAGEICRKTISQIREENELTEDELIEIAKKYRNTDGNKHFGNTSSNGDGFYRIQPSAKNTENEGICDNINDFKIDTLEFYFIAKKAENYIIGHREKEGNMIYDRVGKNAKLSKRDKKRGKKIESNEIEYVFKAEWIIGTKYLINCGMENTIVKEKSNGVKRARLPITIYSDTTPSLMERCISHVDDIHIAIYKLRNAISKHIPAPRIIFDLSVLENSVEMGGKIYSMKKLIANFSKTGVMVVRSKSEWGDDDYGASNKKPFDIVNNSGLEGDINLFLTRIQTSLEQIRQVTGVNEVADGTTVNQDMLKGVMEGLTAATNNALKPTFRLYEGVYENWVKYCALKWQTAVLGGDIDITYTPLDDNTIRHFKLTKDLYDYDFGIKIILKPSEQDKQMLLADIQAKKEQGLLAAHDYFVLYKMISNGDLRQAEVYYSRAVEEQKSRNHQEAMQLQQAQAQAQGEAGIAMEQAKQQTLQMQAEIEMAKINLEYDRKKEIEMLRIEAEKEMNLAKIEGNFVSGVTNKALDMSNNKEEV